MKWGRCARAAMVMALLTGLTACGGEESDLPQAGATSTTPTATATASPTWQAVPDEPPTAPTMAKTAQSAEDFVPFAIEMARYTLATGDADPYLALVTGACIPCATIVQTSAKDTVALYDGPIDVTTGAARLTGDTAVVPARLVQPSSRIVDKATSKVASVNDPVTASLEYELTWKSGSWRLAGWKAATS